MAIPFVQSIDMTDFQILNFVIHSAGTSPTNSGNAGGMAWWDSTNYAVKVYNDNAAAWRPLPQAPTTTTDGNIPVYSGTIGAFLGTGYNVLTSVGTPGVDTALVTDQAVREAIAAAISGGVNYQGGYNAATNTPDLESGTGILKGYMYTVTVAGDFFTDTVAVGDVLIAENDTPTTLAEWTIVAREWDETFLELGDTPSAYTAAGGFMVMVNSTPDALEFVNPATYALSNFDNDLSLSDFTNDLADLTQGTNGGIATFTYDGSLAETVELDFTNLTNETALAGADEFAYYDSGVGMRALTYTALLAALNTDLDYIAGSNTTATLQAPGAGQDGYAITWNNGLGQFDLTSVSTGTTFLSLTDTPSSFAGSAGYFLQVNATPDALVFTESLVMNTGAYVRSGNTAADVLYIGAYDVDGVSPTAFITLTSNNTPTCDLAAGVTINSNAIAYNGGAFHDGFSDYVGNEHVDHTSVTITAGSGLSYSSGGTDISASATIDLDINELTGESAIVDADEIPFYDATAVANRKITYAQLVTALGTSLGSPTLLAGDLGSGATPTITHNLNLTEFTDITVQIWRQSDNKLVGVEIAAATKDTVTVTFGSAALNPTLGTYRYVVTGIQE